MKNPATIKRHRFILLFKLMLAKEQRGKALLLQANEIRQELLSENSGYFKELTRDYPK